MGDLKGQRRVLVVVFTGAVLLTIVPALYVYYWGTR